MAAEPWDHEDTIEADYEARFEQAVRALEAEIDKGEEIPIVELVNRVRSSPDVNPTLVREALSHLLYTGRVILTVDRRLRSGQDDPWSKTR